MPIPDPKSFKKGLLSDLRMELADEFDRNFQRKAFFTDKWKARKDPNANGSLLVVTGTLRRSIQSSTTDNGVRFSSNVPYAAIHNEGLQGNKPVKAHTRRQHGKTVKVRAHTRKFNMPKRQFIGDGDQTRKIIREVIEDNLKQFNLSLSDFFRNK